MARNIGQAGLNLIKEFEGCRLVAYKPVAAEPYWTIGYGHYGPDVYFGMTITQTQADEYLLQDVQNAVASVNNPVYCPVTSELNQNQFDALVSFTFNCGTGSLKQLCKNRSVKQISEHIVAYNKDVTGRVLTGLVRRREAELKLYNTPVQNEVVKETENMSKRYYSIGEIPEWGREAVKRRVESGVIAGISGGLDISLDMVRLLVWMDREKELEKQTGV